MLCAQKVFLETYLKTEPFRIGNADVILIVYHRYARNIVLQQTGLLENQVKLRRPHLESILFLNESVFDKTPFTKESLLTANLINKT